MRKEELIVINFVLRHANEQSMGEVEDVIYALAKLTSNDSLRALLFNKGKEIHSMYESFEDITDYLISEHSET